MRAMRPAPKAASRSPPKQSHKQKPPPLYMPLNPNYPGLRMVHDGPPIFVVDVCQYMRSAPRSKSGRASVLSAFLGFPAGGSSVRSAASVIA